MNYDEIDDCFPFEEYRPHQKEAIAKIIQYLENGEKNIILNAPVGSGKSVIAYTVARYFQNEYAKSFIFTSTKYLQDQYLDDFKFLKSVKGRNNFDCVSDKTMTCDKGSCKTISKYSCPFGVVNDHGSLYMKSNSLDLHCPYWDQKVKAIDNPISILNYKYGLTDKLYVQHFPMREIAIFDEAHNIEQEIMSFLEIEISPKQIKKDVNYIIENPNTDSISTWSDVLREVSAEYKSASDNEQFDQERKDNFLQRSGKLLKTSKWFSSDASNWVIERKNNNITFKPILIAKYSREMLLNLGDQNIFMSGSILKEDMFAESLGIDNYVSVDIPSIIPSENRPIIKKYVGSMSSRQIDNTIDEMVKEILNIANQHKGEKGIIHTYTYKISKLLEERIDDPRFIFHNSRNREQRTRKFKRSNDDDIFVSPYSFEGVDFKYDESRFQMIVKNPFPNIGDPQIKRRDVVSNYKWIYQERCKILSQMYGRSIRAADDYAVTYLLDSDIESLLGDSSLVTHYFCEGLINDNCNKKITIVDVNKLSQDKRRSYANERTNERNVLDAIMNDGLYTLTDLREAYKKLPGDSYKEVKPAFERLLKNKAIKLSQGD
jgi:Rad3-related DNA helicase